MKIIVILSLVILSSCGVQGDLYLPDKSTNNMPEKSTPTVSNS